MNEISELHRQFISICAQLRWRRTSARLAVFEFIHGNKNHPSVDSVWHHVRKTMPTISRDSVYRILNDFANAGLLARLDQIDNARYDTDLNHHGHFICRKCGGIFDFSAVISNEQYQADIQEIGVTDYTELRIVGICKKCLLNKTPQPQQEKE